MIMSKFCVVAFVVLAGTTVLTQETRGTISGTIRDAQGVIPGATTTITNVETNVVQNVVTNSSGYFEAPLLRAGTYDITVEVTGFKTLKRAGIILAGGQQVSLQLTLEIGTINETVTVTGDAPLLEVNTVRTGTNFTERQIANMPVVSNNPVWFARYAAAVSANPVFRIEGQGAVDTPSTTTRSLGGVGTNEWSIDGATNNGYDGKYATSPPTEMLQEMRVESTNFTATVGHGTGIGISMTTKAGTNTLRGTLSHQYWNNRFNPPNTFQKEVFDKDTLAKDAYEEGHSNYFTSTLGGPILRNKFFFFANYFYTNDNFSGKNASKRTIPANDKQLAGDFSDLLLLPNGSQYQIYDPLTTRPDPARPGHVIRDPFPGNIIPADRITNPLYKLYTGLLPTPNQNPTSPTQEPLNNYYDAAQPGPLRNHVWSGRVDYNHSENNRFFFRNSGNYFTSDISDWTYLNQPGLHALGRIRTSTSNTGTWTKVLGQTVIDSQFAYTRFLEHNRRLGLKAYTPGSVGLPGYMDDFCTARGNFGDTPSCSLPQMTITGYTSISANSGTYDQVKNYQAQLNLSHVRGSHTLKAGTDVRRHNRVRNDPGNVSGNFTFDNTYMRKADDTTVYPAGNFGLSWAAFMLGMPTTVAVDNTAQYNVTSPWVGTYIQDTWRITPKLTFSGGLRYEYEDGITESNDQMLVGFDPNATLSITKLAEAAYAANPIPELPPSAFAVLGGSVYASGSGKSWKGQSMWMPRASVAYSVNDKTVVKAGYGLYYDTLDASKNPPLQTGFSQRTTSHLSVDFGQTYLLGDPKHGVSPMLDPFPVQANGLRFQPVLGNSLGADSTAGVAFTAPNLDRTHPRVQRWRASLQRELSRNISVEIAYNGTYGDHLGASIRQDYLPEQYWNGSNVRDLTQQNLLNANVTNPFYIGNFDSLRTTNPALYAQMAGNSFFTSRTIQKNRLLRAFPQMSSGTGLYFEDLPVGKNRGKSIEITLDRRFANGFSANVVYTGTKFEDLTIVDEYDRAPWYWLTSNEARPHRLTGSFNSELPFGRSKKFLNGGGVLSAIFGGWEIGGNFEYQPGALLQWNNNVFFYGDLEDIAVQDPTLDRWFNVDAGFERHPARVPAAFQKRAFPFRVDGVRGPNLKLLNLSFLRSIGLSGGRRIQFRVDMLNALNRMHYADPNLNPTSTQFGTVTQASGTVMRFVTFVTRLYF
jgi:hypothetical protein